MHHVIEVSDRRLLEVHDVGTLDDAVRLANQLLREHFKLLEVDPANYEEDVDFGWASKEYGPDMGAWSSIKNTHYDAYVA